jgi:hypothetical protein
MFRLVIKPPVGLTLSEVYCWYEEQLPGLGERFLNEVDASFKKLTILPHSYSLLTENYRQLVLRHFPYKIIFEIIEKDIVIYSVFHSKTIVR